MKKIVIASLSCLLAFFIAVGGALGYVYYDFSVKGTSSAEFRFKDDFDDKIYAQLNNIRATYSDGTLTSTSQEIKVNGIGVYATISEGEDTGTLILAVNQNVAPYTPFEIRMIQFTEGKKNSEGEYISYHDLYLEGYDKNGERLLFQPAGSLRIDENGVRTTEFFIRYSDRYLKAQDIENAFPISVELNGHMATMTRASMF